MVDQWGPERAGLWAPGLEKAMVQRKVTAMAGSLVPEMADWMEASLGNHLEQLQGIEMAGY